MHEHLTFILHLYAECSYLVSCFVLYLIVGAIKLSHSIDIARRMHCFLVHVTNSNQLLERNTAVKMPSSDPASLNRYRIVLICSSY